MPGIEDHGQLPRVGAEAAVAGRQLVDHVGELGDIRTVAGIGVREQRDAAVAGDHQAEPDQAQVRAFLLGLAPTGLPRERCRVDEGGHIGHIQRQRRRVHTEHVDDPRRDAPLDLDQRRGVAGMHRVPEPAMIQRRLRHLHQMIPRRARPPVDEGQFGAGIHDPIQRRQREIGTHRGPRVGAAAPGHLVDDLDHPQLLDHRPGRSQITETQMPAARGHTRPPPIAASISAAVPRYFCSTIRGLPLTRAEVAR